MVLCSAGHKSGLKCDHKRNLGEGITKCGIDATKEKCSFAISDEDHLAKVKAIMKGGK